MTHTLTLIPGDGIGPEVSDAVVRIIAAAGVQIEWDRQDAGLLAFQKTGHTLPAELRQPVGKNKVPCSLNNKTALQGPVTTPAAAGFTSANPGLRTALDLYSNLRPVINLPGVSSRFQNVDIVIVRENTEDLYAGLEHVVVKGVVESLKIITEVASTRIAEFAFDYARRYGRKKVTAIHKANIMKLSDGLFIDCCRAVSKKYPEITYDERIVDAACMQFVMVPERFDVLVLPNLYGDIVSDLCAGLVGGLGVVPGANLGLDYAVFEAVHGSAPDIAGQNLANPTALLQSGLMMLRHINEGAAADRIMAALCRVLVNGHTRTRDLGGTATTTAFTDAVIAAL